MAEQQELAGVPQPGEVVGGKYRVERVLGVGGMGAVVAATHITLNQRVAIKFLLADVAKNPNNVARFSREAQAAALIQSDHVAKVSDVGTREDGAPYMVLEYLDGEDLAHRIARGPAAQSDVVVWVLEACEALAEAHKRGIVHRDLKPANLFLARRPDGGERVKLLDFGISKMTGGPALTRTSALMGSPLYMAPEQMKSAKNVDARSDIWALGCILYEALSGRPPFVGETLPEICSRILTEPPNSIRKLVPQLGDELEQVLERCLEKDPEHRYQSVAELAFAIAPFGDDRAQRSAATIAHVLEVERPPAVQPAAGGVTENMPHPPQGAAVNAAAGSLLGPAAQAAQRPFTQPDYPAQGYSAQGHRVQGYSAQGHPVQANYSAQGHPVQANDSAQPHLQTPQRPAIGPHVNVAAPQALSAAADQAVRAGYPAAPHPSASDLNAPAQSAAARAGYPEPTALAGASTAAPVETSAAVAAVTTAGKGRWVAAAALLMGLGGGAALLFAAADSDSQPPRAATTGAAAVSASASVESAAPVALVPSSSPTLAIASASASVAPPKATKKATVHPQLPSLTALVPRLPAPPSRPTRPRPSKQPPRPNPNSVVRPGDDLFNTRKP